jgi:hypothetical protein
MRRAGTHFVAAWCVVAFALTASGAHAGIETPHDIDAPQDLVTRRPGASPGYTLFAPERLERTYLVDLDGEVVHTWDHDSPPGQSQYLLPDGHLLRAGEERRGARFERGKGGGGVIEELRWDGTPVWRFVYSSDEHRQHHDIEPLPNGNVLFIAWEHLTSAEALTLGRRPDLLSSGELWPDTIIEVDPTNDEIVWRWRVRDHVVQDRDPSLPGFGSPAEHPERIDINYTLGEHGARDWNHINSVAYDASLDQIVVSVRQFSEVWVIDHDTTTEEARGPAGDLLFRFGNPEAYGRGTAADQELFTQHDARWQRDETGAVSFLVLNNGQKDKREYSSVDEIHPVMTGERYAIGADGRFAATLTRVYPDGDGGPDRFFAFNTSGSQRLPNDNVLVTDGPHGRIFEVTPDGEVVWDYVNPYFGSMPSTPSRSGSGFVTDPWRLFRADRYPPDHPGLARLE